ncbi:MAG: rhomboid family intramembrane serine protease [Armatimonadota bacterium]|nr:rhomboid family intramembrane serine protease [Armatimonadota bacterium]MDR5696640.1 rhomboid family intramembrane serine protease [Armatimonadota bacterium]
MLRGRSRHPLLALPGGCPVTWALLAANALTFVASFVGVARWDALAFHTADAAWRPWTAVTYPLVGSGPILWLLVGAYVVWMFGGSLERAWGARDYLIFLMLCSLVAAAGLWVGAALTGRAALLEGLWMPLAAAVVAWSQINPRERVLAFFVLPVESRWLGAIAAVVVVFSFSFPLGAFALFGPALAWWFARRGRYSLGRLSRRLLPSPAARLHRWWLRRRFRRLMRISGLEDRDRIH